MNPSPIATRPTLPRYVIGEPMRCPACCGRHWIVGRQSAECAEIRAEVEGGEPERCGYVIELAGVIEGKSSPIRFSSDEGPACV